MGRRRLLFAPELLMRLTHGTFTTVGNATPDDAQIVGAGYDSLQRALYVDVESPTYTAGADNDTVRLPLVRQLADFTEADVTMLDSIGNYDFDEYEQAWSLRDRIKAALP